MSKKSNMRRLLEDIRKSRIVDTMSREQMRDLLIAITKKLGCRLVVRTADVRFEKVADFTSESKAFDDIINDSSRKIWTTSIMIPDDDNLRVLQASGKVGHCAAVNKNGDVTFNFIDCEGVGLSEEESYSELLSLFVMPNGGYVSIANVKKMIKFPACASISQLRMRMAIEEGA